jgi:hypothetical protein
MIVLAVFARLALRPSLRTEQATQKVWREMKPATPFEMDAEQARVVRRYSDANEFRGKPQDKRSGFLLQVAERHGIGGPPLGDRQVAKRRRQPKVAPDFRRRDEASRFENPSD